MFKDIKRIKCFKCKYEWFTKSRLKYVSCPNCMNKCEVKKCILKKK